MSLLQEWKANQTYTLADPAPWDLAELRLAVDVADPRSVAAYWVWAVCRLADDFEGGMEMMRYLFADIEPFGRGFTEGGLSGKAGWDAYFNERLRDADYRWLPRAYFEGASPANGFKPSRPLTLALRFNGPNTDTVNGQTRAQLGRLNIVYWVASHAGGNQVNITLSRFEGSARWYVTGGASSTALFYDQRGAVGADALALAKSAEGDDSTAEEHRRRYAGANADEMIRHMIDMPLPAAPDFSTLMGPGDAEYRAYVQNRRDSWTCRSCGTTGTGNFCPNCGARRPQ